MTWKTLIGSAAAYVIILFRHGYTFGSGDQSEMLPYAKFVKNNTLYANDFYIQNIAAHVPNVRFVFSWLLSFADAHLAEVAFGVHAVATILLIAGLHRIASKFIMTEIMRWLAVLVPILLIYGINLGGNELYYNSLIPSYLAQVAGVWAFVFLLEGYLRPPYIFVGIATALHPLIGVQIWLIIVLLNSRHRIAEIEHWWLRIFLPNAIYVIAAGIYIGLIKANYDGGAAISSRDFLDIIAFRAPHHYFPDSFGWLSWLILLPMFVIHWIAAHSGMKRMIYIMVGGCIVYSTGIYVFGSPTILSTQWFATTVWLKMLAVIAVFGLIESFVFSEEWAESKLDKQLAFNGLLVGAFVALVLMTPQYLAFKNKPYDFPYSNVQSSEVDISKLAKEKTPTDALFLIPSDLSEFRFWSERSSFIDYKATNHRQAAFAEWYARIQKIYNISLADRRAGVENLTELANAHFQELTENDFLKLADSQHITHVLTFKNHVLNFPKIAENSKYVIYKIEK